MEQNQQPRKADVAKFAELLRRRRRAAPRFSIDAAHYAADVPELLKVCYQHEVERRGRAFRDDEETAGHLQKVAKWLTGGSLKPGLLLYGTPGNGKTTIAQAAAQLINLLYADETDYYNERIGVITISALDLADIAKREESGYLKRIKTAPLLHIDDVGCEPVAVKVWGNEVSPLVEVLYSRYDRQLYTVLTSNLGDEDILRRYGVRIADRFREMFDYIAFENRSYR